MPAAAGPCCPRHGRLRSRGPRRGQVLAGLARHRMMARAEVERLLLELTDLGTWAQGIDRLLQMGVAGWQPWPYFIDEHKVWA